MPEDTASVWVNIRRACEWYSCSERLFLWAGGEEAVGAGFPRSYENAHSPGPPKGPRQADRVVVGGAFSHEGGTHVQA